MTTGIEAMDHLEFLLARLDGRIVWDARERRWRWVKDVQALW